MSGKSGLQQHLEDEGHGVELPEQPQQGDLLGGSAPDGAQAARAPGLQPEKAAGEKTGKPGRPPGAKNRSTAEMVRYLQTFGAGPLVGMAKIVNMIDDKGLPDFAAIQEHCGLTGKGARLAAVQLWVQCSKELAPYMHQKLPMAVDLKTGADVKVIVLNTGQTVADAETDPDALLPALAGPAESDVIDADFEDLGPEDENQ